MNTLNKAQYWFQTKPARIGFGVAAVIVIGLIVIFSQQIGQLFDLFGSRAGITPSTIRVGEDANPFLPGDPTKNNSNSFEVVEVDGQSRLMLKAPASN